MRVRRFIYFGVLPISLFGLIILNKQNQHSTLSPGSISTAPVRSPLVLSTARYRPVYPFSIVPGGVKSKEELKAAIDLDPLVAQHYAQVEVSRLRPVTLPNDTAAYVSFRMHGQVYWTSHKLRLAKGERIFQGTSIGVRERCGNQISEQPRAPVLPNAGIEPTAEVLDTPVAPVAPPGLVAEIPSLVSLGLHLATIQEGDSRQPPVGGNGLGYYGSPNGSGGVVATGGMSGGSGVGSGTGTGSSGQFTPLTPSVIGAPGVILAQGLVALPPSFTFSIWGPMPSLPLLWYTPANAMTPPATPPAGPPVEIYLAPPIGIHLAQIPVVTPVGPPPSSPDILTPDLPPTIPAPPVRPVTVTVTQPPPPGIAVPEPGTWLLIAAGSALVLVSQRRRAR